MFGKDTELGRYYVAYQRYAGKDTELGRYYVAYQRYAGKDTELGRYYVWQRHGIRSLLCLAKTRNRWLLCGVPKVRGQRHGIRSLLCGVLNLTEINFTEISLTEINLT